MIRNTAGRRSTVWRQPRSGSGGTGGQISWARRDKIIKRPGSNIEAGRRVARDSGHLGEAFSSPEQGSAPQVEFSRAMRMMRTSTALSTRGCPE
jgi:hypothetical protein